MNTETLFAYTLNTVIILTTLAGCALAGYALYRLVLKFYRTEPKPEMKALDEFEASLLRVQREQKNLATDLTDLKVKCDGLIEIMLAFIDDLEVSKHRLEILQAPDINQIRGGSSFYDHKLAALLGALNSTRQAELLASERGFTQAEIVAIERYIDVVLNRVIAVRGTIAHTRLKLRKSGYVALLQQMSSTLQSCEDRLCQLNEPGYVQLYQLPAGVDR